ncbi:MAG: FkbM family methyltransferase [Solirubrobacterales bacterium]
MLTARRRGGLRSGITDAGLGLADRLRRRGLTVLGARTRALTAALSGDRFWIEVDGVRVGGSLIHHGRYLRLLVQGGFGSPLFHLGVFERALSPGMVIVDCGAHIGLHTVLAARSVGSTGKVIALEPDPVNLRALHANVEANGLADRVEVVEAAASERPGSVRLHLDSSLDVSMRATGSIDPLGGFPNGVGDRVQGSDSLHSSIDVPCVTLDDVVGERFDVAKIDVEGAEPEVLRGMAKALRRSRGATVFIECHPSAMLRAGTSPAEWLTTLRDGGSLLLIDEHSRRLLPASDDEIDRAVRELGGWPFNVLWNVGEAQRAGADHL